MAYETAVEIDADKRFGPFSQRRAKLVLFGLLTAIAIFVLEGAIVHPPLKWAWLPMVPVVLVLIRMAVPHKGRPFGYWLRVWPRHWTLPRVMDMDVVQRVMVRSSTEEVTNEDLGEVGVVLAETGPPRRAVIEVDGILNLRLADNETIGTQIQRLAYFLNRIVPSSQILVRTRPMDMSHECQRLRQTGDPADADFADFLERWIKGRPDKRWYVAVAGKDQATLERNVKSVLEGLRRVRLHGRWVNGDLRVTLDECWAAQKSPAKRMVIGPHTFERADTHVIVDGKELSRTLLLTRAPTTVEPDWLKDLIDSNLPVDVVLWLDPLNRAEQIAELGGRSNSWQMSQYHHVLKKGYRAPDLDDQIRDVEGMKRALRRHQTRLFSMTIAFVLRARTAADLADLEGQVVDIVAEHVGQQGVLPADCEHELGHRLGVPLGEAELQYPIRAATPLVARTNPFVDSGLVMRGKIRIPIGTSDESGRPVLYSPFVFANPHELAFGTSGAGKGFLEKVKLDRWARLDPWMRAVIVDTDPDHEYTPLARGLGGVVWNLTHAPDGCSVPDCTAHLRTMYAMRGGAFGDGGTFIRLQQALTDFELTFNSDRQWAPRVTVFDLSEMPEKLRPLTILAIMRGVQQLARALKREVLPEWAVRPQAWSERMHREHATHTRPPYECHWLTEAPDQWRWALLLDELWSLLDPDAPQECGPALEGLWRTGRHDHVQAIGITQRPTDVLGSKRGRVLQDISLTKVYMRQQDTEVLDNAKRMRLSAKEQDFIMGADQGEGIFVADHKRVAFSLRDQVSRREFEMART
jgi:hypothetical protein